MGFGQSVKYCFNNYANFNGRASRSEFWWWYLFYAIVVIVPFVIAGIFFAAGQPDADIYGNTDTSFPVGAVLFYIVGILISLALILPYLAVGCRRLHDRGMSGWLQLLLFVPCASIVLLIFWLLPGNPGPNEYGEGPARA